MEREEEEREEKRTVFHFSLSHQKHNAKIVISAVNLIVKVLKIPQGPVIFLFQSINQTLREARPVSGRERRNHCPVCQATGKWDHVQEIGLLHTCHSLSRSALAPLQTRASLALLCFVSLLQESGGFSWNCQSGSFTRDPRRSKMKQQYQPPNLLRCCKMRSLPGDGGKTRKMYFM